MTPARRDRVASIGLAAAPLLGIAALCGIVGVVAVRGYAPIDLGFLTSAPSAAGREGGIGPMLVATAWALLIGVGTAAPLGLAAGVYLAEYARDQGGVLRGAMDVLASLPSIVFGLFGMAFFCEALGMGWSVLAGGLTVAMMILPLFVRLVEVGLRAVPDDWRAAGAALALPRWVLLRRVLLPQAAPALAAALALATGRVLSESAVFLFTAGASTRFPEGPLDPGRVLAVHVYLLSVEVPGGQPRAAAAALVLLVAVIGSVMAANLFPRLLLRGATA